MLDVLYWLLMILYIPACLGLIVIVLLQKGKGTGFAGAFGVGPGSETVFGPRARKSLPVKLTYIAAATFMVIALLMSMISGRVGKGAAPALAEVTEESAPATSSLESLGLGTNKAGTAVETTEGSGESTEAAIPAPVDESATPQAEIETFEVEPTPESTPENTEEAPPTETEPPAETDPAGEAPPAESDAPAEIDPTEETPPAESEETAPPGAAEPTP